MQNNPTTNTKKRGRPLLSPNGVREELKGKRKTKKKQTVYGAREPNG
jgi:hypothetical protein